MHRAMQQLSLIIFSAIPFSNAELYLTKYQLLQKIEKNITLNRYYTSKEKHLPRVIFQIQN